MNKEIKVLNAGHVALIDHMGNDNSVVSAARQSVAKELFEDPKANEQFVRDLMRWGHLTPFEFVTFTFHVKAPIFVYRQWHRSRTQSYVEKSGRYTEIMPEFYEPEDSVFTKGNPSLDKEPITLHNCKNPDDWVDAGFGTKMYDTEDFPWSWKAEFKKQQDLNLQEYKRWVGTGARKELARINTPVSQYSEMYMTTDLRNLFHWLELRLNDHAQWEIRQYGNAILELIKDIVPVSCQAFEDYVLNSIKFSKEELICLSQLLDRDFINKYPEDVSKYSNFSEKEGKEFLGKLNRVLKNE